MFIHLIEKLLGIPLMFQFYYMSPDKFVSFILVRKMKTKGATRSQNCPNNVAYLKEKVYVVWFSKNLRGAINVFLYQKKSKKIINDFFCINIFSPANRFSLFPSSPSTFIIIEKKTNIVKSKQTILYCCN